MTINDPWHKVLELEYVEWSWWLTQQLSSTAELQEHLHKSILSINDSTFVGGTISCDLRLLNLSALRPVIHHVDMHIMMRIIIIDLLPTGRLTLISLTTKSNSEQM